MRRSTSTAAYPRSPNAREPRPSVTEATMFLSKFYQKRATRRALDNVPGSEPDIPSHDGGNASTSAHGIETVEVQAKDLDERPHWRDLPTILLTKDTGEVMILWSPSERRDSSSSSEQPDRISSAQPDMTLPEQPDSSPSGRPDRSPLKQLNSSQCGPGVQDLEGKECKAIPSIHRITANRSKDVSRNSSRIRSSDRSSEGECPKLGSKGVGVGYRLATTTASCLWRSVSVFSALTSRECMERKRFDRVRRDQ